MERRARVLDRVIEELTKPPREVTGVRWTATPLGRHLPLQGERKGSTDRGGAVTRGVASKGVRIDAGRKRDCKTCGERSRNFRVLRSSGRGERPARACRESRGGRGPPRAARVRPFRRSPGQPRSYRVFTPHRAGGASLHRPVPRSRRRRLPRLSLSPRPRETSPERRPAAS